MGILQRTEYRIKFIYEAVCCGDFFCEWKAFELIN